MSLKVKAIIVIFGIFALFMVLLSWQLFEQAR